MRKAVSTVFGLWALTFILSAQAPDALPIWTVDPVDRSSVDYTHIPLWAYGAAHTPHADDAQAVQGAPDAPLSASAWSNMSRADFVRERRLEGSTAVFTWAEIRNERGNAYAVDWFPEHHPNPMPPIITRGPEALGSYGRACGGCHLADGSGRPENASPAGLSAAYILRQLGDFKHGLCHSAEPAKANSNTMVMLAKAMTEAEMQEAADYFSAVPWRPHVTVVETDLVPTTRMQGELFIATGTELTEPIGNRIIEVPDDEEASQVLRSSGGTWTAYVPVGAVARGENLVTTGGASIVNGEILLGRATACNTCHGLDLLGMAPDIPPLAGRSPSYLAREIFDIQQGVRAGSYELMPLMKLAVERLTADDIIDITAYLASLPVDGVAQTDRALSTR